MTDILPVRITQRELFVYAADRAWISDRSLRRKPSLSASRIGTAYRSRGGRHYWPTQRRDTLPLPSHPVSIPPNSPSYP
jgi:hypothetical protein